MWKDSNRWMIIIPGLLMLFLFVAGWLYVTAPEEVTHADLKHHLFMDANIEKEKFEASWDWTLLPEGELVGEDYIGVVAYADGRPISGESYEAPSLQLTHGGEMIYTDEGSVVDEGIIFSFPNRMDSNVIYGHQGNVSLKIPEEAEEVIISYLHTWAGHAGQGGDDPRFESPPFPGMDDEMHFWWVEKETVAR